MISVRHSGERGQVNHGWLEARHSFSFGNYYDPEHMGVSSLRVINDDHIAAGQGFPTHSHQDMEIITYVTNGSIEHKDSMGNTKTLSAGEFQLMSAGSGISHSEYNPSAHETLSLFQIWVQPNQLGIEPGYQQKKFEQQQGLQLIASPDARNNSLLIHQDAYLYQLRLNAAQTASHQPSQGRTIYVHLVAGEITINGAPLAAGDGATISDVAVVDFHGSEDAEALIFDLP